jgi:hypothetical protein
VGHTVSVGLSSEMLSRGLSSGLLSFGKYSIAGLSSRMLNRGWSSGMFSYGTFSMYRVVIYDFICRVVIWNVI